MRKGAPESASCQRALPHGPNGHSPLYSSGSSAQPYSSSAAGRSHTSDQESLPVNILRRIPYVQQMQQADCGAACLAMVLAYHGKHLPLEEVRSLTGFGRDGTDAKLLLQASRSLGLDGQGFSIDLDDLDKLEPGAILHWEFNHFVVFERLRKHDVWIVDPRSGRRRVPLELFRRSFTGVVLEFVPEEGFNRSKPTAHSVWRHLHHLLTRPGLLVEVILTSVLLQILALSVPLLTSSLVDRVVPRNDYDLLWALGIGLGVISFFYFLSTVVRGHLLVHLRFLIDRQMTQAFMRHLVRLPYTFFQERPAGDLLLRASSNATVREVLTSGTLSILLDGVLACVYMILLFTINISMGVLAVGLGLLQVVILRIAHRRYAELTAEGLSAQARSQSYLVQMIGGMETLKASGAEERAADTWSTLFTQELSSSLARGRLGATTDALLITIRSASPLIMLFVGGLLVLNDQLTLGTMLALQALTGSFLAPLSALVSTTMQLQTVRTHLDRLNDVLDSPLEQPLSNTIPAAPLRGEITLDQVSFQYGPVTLPTLHDVTLAIQPGQFVAIVGRSGSGKSTLGRIMLGLFEPATGAVLYDGIPLTELDIRSVRKQLGVVPQNTFLFGTSIRENITLNNPEITMDKAVWAAKLAQIHDEIIRMPMGYDTPLNDSGTSLSGGQRQRLALARALVHRPSILLLDEATSALDTVTEQRVQEGLDELHCTRVVITQRLSTIVQADLIVVMERGRVVETGTHTELLRAGRQYAELVQAQQL